VPASVGSGAARKLVGHVEGDGRGLLGDRGQPRRAADEARRHDFERLVDVDEVPDEHGDGGSAPE